MTTAALFDDLPDRLRAQTARLVAARKVWRREVMRQERLARELWARTCPTTGMYRACDDTGCARCAALLDQHRAWKDPR